MRTYAHIYEELPKHDLGRGQAASIFGLAHSAFWKRALHMENSFHCGLWPLCNHFVPKNPRSPVTSLWPKQWSLTLWQQKQWSLTLWQQKQWSSTSGQPFWSQGGFWCSSCKPHVNKNGRKEVSIMVAKNWGLFSTILRQVFYHLRSIYVYPFCLSQGVVWLGYKETTKGGPLVLYVTCHTLSTVHSFTPAAVAKSLRYIFVNLKPTTVSITVM